MALTPCTLAAAPAGGGPVFPFDDPETELLDAEAWDFPVRLTRETCRDHTGGAGRRLTPTADEEDDDQ